MVKEGRDQPRNHFVVGFTPNGADVHEAIQPVVEELRNLAKVPFMVVIDGVERWVIIKLLSLSADMAEGNGLAGVKSASAAVPCRFCELPRAFFNADALLMPRWEQQVYCRQTHSTEAYRLEVDETTRPSAAHLQKKGLKRRSIFEIHGPAFNQFVQVALDVSHSEQKGIGEKLIYYIVDQFFSQVGLDEFSKILKQYTFPPDTPRQPNISKRAKMIKMNEVTLMISHMPFMFKRMDTTLDLFKPTTIAKMNSYHEKNGNPLVDTPLVMKSLIDTFLSIAKANRVIFSYEFDASIDGADPYAELESLLMVSRKKVFDLLLPLDKDAKEKAEKLREDYDIAKAVVEKAIAEEFAARQAGLRAAAATAAAATGQVQEAARGTERGRARSRGRAGGNTARGRGNKARGLPAFRKPRIPNSITTLPNYHTASHCTSNARNYGTAANSTVTIGEIQHRIFKQLMVNSNYFDIDLQFCRYANTFYAIREIMDGSESLPATMDTWKLHLGTIRTSVPSLTSGYFFGSTARVSEDGKTARKRDGPASLLVIGPIKAKIPGANENVDREVDRFPDIILGAQIIPKEARLRGYTTKLTDLQLTDNVVQGLWTAYVGYGIPFGTVKMTMRGIGERGQLKWWESLQLFDTFNDTKYTIYPGSVVPLLYKYSDGKESEVYGEVSGICTHRHDVNDYIFLHIRWLEKCGIDDDMGGLQRYRITPWDSVDATARRLNFVTLHSLTRSKQPAFVKDQTTDTQFWLNTTHFKSAARWVESRARWVESRARWVESRARWVESRARWVESRARWVESRARWVGSRAR
ncbi:hypothetical protein BJ508DRAFT_330386 [Ascobolus immersus RN42]|uniref:Uncharacterized protein n=1 Tax=Ascobolus immersus RN42 TaxID=1160509 RepID=A0A3N4HVQ4_ASCIM|nr:hypothetical protein BJ508DRAFT_330386 [Ascobolus immersus RN42]